MKEKMWAFGDDFAIQDADGNDVFEVDGKAFSLGDKLSFKDTSGNELAFISQKLMSLKKTYEIYREGALFAQVQKEWRFFKTEFTVDVPGPNDYSIDGSFWKHEYEFRRGGKVVAVVSKDFWTWSDTYGIDIVAGEDDVSILCSAIVIDQVLHEDGNSK